MLESLTIRDVLLIDHLELAFLKGLTVLTGETGAGKSILLDALGVALGERASPQLVRPGKPQALVTATFSFEDEDHPVFAFLKERDMALDEGLLILRRSIGSDGKSRAFLNDRPVTASFLKELAGFLVEIHGQFDQLLSPLEHRRLLDLYGGLEKEKTAIKQAFQTFKDLEVSYQKAQETLQRALENQAFLTHAVEELITLAPQDKEETTLLKERLYLANHTKIQELLYGAEERLSSEKGIDAQLCQVLRDLEKMDQLTEGRTKALLEGFQRVYEDLIEQTALLKNAMQDGDASPHDLESLDDRLFALRAVARKHHVGVDDLPALLERLKGELDTVEGGEAHLEQLQKDVELARQVYLEKAQCLTKARQQVSGRFCEAVMAELPPLKLERARIRVLMTPLEPHQWSPEGLESVEFMIETNPGLPPGPLSKIASGGERSRFMLALKVVLSQKGRASMIVFDEIDAGVGGAVASAIGERLAQLGQDVQVLAITHSPQVASYAGRHAVVSKSSSSKEGMTTTQVRFLEDQERLEEIARMLAGEEITQEARAAADQLLRKAC